MCSGALQFDTSVTNNKMATRHYLFCSSVCNLLYLAIACVALCIQLSLIGAFVQICILDVVDEDSCSLMYVYRLQCDSF